MRIKLLKSSLAVILASVLTLGISFASILSPTSAEQNDKVLFVMQQLLLVNPNLKIVDLKSQILNKVEHPAATICECKVPLKDISGYHTIIDRIPVCIPC